MALNTCDEHDDVMVVWSFGRDCPLCRANTAIESLVAYEFLPQRRKDLDGGASLIAQERTRQILVEGWTAAHDDEHVLAEMAIAGLSYASVAASQVRLRDGCMKEVLPTYWPWAKKWWKPSDDPIRNLTKAGALIAAEIDRLQRKAAG